MKLNFKINFFLLLLAALISVALMFAFVELPTLIDNLLQKSNRFPAGDYGSITSDSFEMKYYVRGMGLRWIGYGSLVIILALIVTGFVTRKSGFVWTGAIAMYLPVFGGFAMSMFFLSGLVFYGSGLSTFYLGCTGLVSNPLRTKRSGYTVDI